MDLTAAQFWFNVIVFVVNVALWLFVWNSNRNRVTREKMEEMEESFGKQIRELSVEMGRMDERLKKAIGHPELEPLHKRMNSVDTRMAEMSGEFKGVKHLLELIHETLLNGGGKR